MTDMDATQSRYSPNLLGSYLVTFKGIHTHVDGLVVLLLGYLACLKAVLVTLKVLNPMWMALQCF